MSAAVLRVQEWSSMDTPTRAALMARGTEDIFNADLRASITTIIDDVRSNGDDAVCRALWNFDKTRLEPSQLRVTPDEIEAAISTLDADLIQAVDTAIANVRLFNEHVIARVGGDWRVEAQPGMWVGEQTRSISAAGLFCPSGKASYPSVMIQLGVPATVAGVPTRVVVTPPVPGTADGRVDPATLLVCQRVGITDIFRVNGPAGIAAAGFGTATIPAVRKIVGPGSPAVVCAQIEMQRHGVATMMLLGPTESMVIADDTTDPIRLAADLLIEAEHGTDSTVVLVAIGHEIVNRVQPVLLEQLAALPDERQAAARASLGVNGGAVVVSSAAEAADVANQFAAEHLQIATAHPESLLGLIDHAGEALLGQDTPFSAGNFVLGPPASLPTSGFAKVSSGITAEAFIKRTAVAKANSIALEQLSPAIIALADHEGFPAHGNALRLRYPNSPNSAPGPGSA